MNPKLVLTPSTSMSMRKFQIDTVQLKSLKIVTKMVYFDSSITIIMDTSGIF